MPERDAWIHMVGEDEAQGELQALPHCGRTTCSIAH
jgi:hypothetical protein